MIRYNELWWKTPNSWQWSNRFRPSNYFQFYLEARICSFKTDKDWFFCDSSLESQNAAFHQIIIYQNWDKLIVTNFCIFSSFDNWNQFDGFNCWGKTPELYNLLASHFISVILLILNIPFVFSLEFHPC